MNYFSYQANQRRTIHAKFKQTTKPRQRFYATERVCSDNMRLVIMHTYLHNIDYQKYVVVIVVNQRNNNRQFQAMSLAICYLS